MAISFISTATRPSASIAWYTNSGLPVVTAMLNSWHSALPDTPYENVISDDGLTNTNTVTFKNLEDFNVFYNYIMDLNLAVEFINYCGANPGFTNSRTVSGFGNITIAATYNFPNSTESASYSIDRLRANDVAHLTDLQVLSDKVIVTHTYADAADFSSAHFNDVVFAQNLVDYGVTKTISITAN